MGDDIDNYLARQMKNWAVFQQPPQEARKNLMVQAAASSEGQGQTFNRFLSRITRFWSILNGATYAASSNESYSGYLSDFRPEGIFIPANKLQVWYFQSTFDWHAI